MSSDVSRRRGSCRNAKSFGGFVSWARIIIDEIEVEVAIGVGL